MRNFFNYFLSNYLLLFLSIYADDIKNTYQYTEILDIPNLSFHEDIFTGLDILEQMDFKLLENKSIGILSNQTSINNKGLHILDLIKDKNNIKLLAIFEPEYGIWGTEHDDIQVIGEPNKDPNTGARIFKLMGRSVYPPDWIMEKIDYVIIDIQDTGVRYSTFLTSISKILESANKHKVNVLVLDRPNPLGGVIIEGPLPRTEFQSFESYHLMPIRHGLTIGESVLMINEMGWAKDLKRAKVKIIPMANWKREMYYDETNLIWKKPLPYLSDIESLLMYLGFNLFRGTNLDVGLGTSEAFMVFGSPWLVTSFLLDKVNRLNLEGVSFSEITYYSKINIRSEKNLDNNSIINGLRINIDDRNQVRPLHLATSILKLIYQLHPKELKWEENGYIDKLFGSDLLRVLIAKNKSYYDFTPHWVKDQLKFSQFRKDFLLYK